MEGSYSYNSPAPDPDGTSLNVSEAIHGALLDGAGAVFTAIILGTFILITIMGNFFVIFAIGTERNLKGVANRLILSLAVADLMVAILVMPLSAYVEISGQLWTLGPELCRMWTSFDVLCCTSSILHLLAIALDRYWAVTNIEYARNRSSTKINLLIAGVWFGSAVISFAPMFGWKDPDFYSRLEIEGRCLISQNMIYQIFATCLSFYLPLICILVLYWNIYKQAKKRIRHKPGGAGAVLIERNSSGSSNLHQTSDLISQNGLHPNQSKLIVLAKRENKHAKETTESKRERKAAKTLVIITGTFVVCWLPFFIMALTMSVCVSCEPHDFVFSFLLWLGYTNSLLNPIIYTIFSPDFRNAFKRMLCGTQSVTQRH